MSRKYVRWIAVALGAAIFIAAIKLALRNSRDLPFDAQAWRAHSATDKWAGGNLRYWMRKDAAKAAQRCKTVKEVIALLGYPDGSGNYAKPHDDNSPGSSFTYNLGALPEPFRFWVVRSAVELEVTINRRNRILSARVVDRIR